MGGRAQDLSLDPPTQVTPRGVTYVQCSQELHQLAGLWASFFFLILLSSEYELNKRNRNQTTNQKA